MVFKKIIFQNSLMANETPLRPPPPFMANAILNFHFDFPGTSLIWGWRSRAVAQEAIVGPPLSTSFKISSALGEVLFYNVAREVLKIEITLISD